MRLKQRLAILGVLAALFFLANGLGRHYSPALIAHVVEEALVEKAPPGTDRAWLHERLAAPEKEEGGAEAYLQRLLAISQRLEKVQSLTGRELQSLLGGEVSP